MANIQQSPQISSMQPAGHTISVGPVEVTRTNATTTYSTGPTTTYSTGPTTTYSTGPMQSGMTEMSRAGGVTTYTGPAEVTTRTTETIHQPTYSASLSYQQHGNSLAYQQHGNSLAYQQHGNAQQYHASNQYQASSQMQQHLSTQHLSTQHLSPSPHSYVGTSREISAASLTGTETIIGERVVEHEIKVPKRVVREEIIEKVIVVPEKIVHEEVIEETQMVREKVVEIAKPVYQEKIIEVPEIEYIEKIIEVPERVVQEKIREVPRVEIQERVVEVPKITYSEKIVEVPEIEYREIPVERIVEVPQIQEQVVIREVAVPQYVDKPIPEHVNVEVAQRVERNIPIPVEAVTTFEYRLPHIRPTYKKATFPVYVPRFVEVPVPEELVSGAVGQQAANLAQHVSLLTTQAAPSLCEIENIAADIKKMDLASHIASSDYHSTIQQAWAKGSLNISPAGDAQMRAIATTNGAVGVQSNAQSFVPVVYQSQSRDESDRHHSKRERSAKDSRKQQTRSGRSSARVR